MKLKYRLLDWIRNLVYPLARGWNRFYGRLPRGYVRLVRYSYKNRWNDLYS